MTGVYILPHEGNVHVSDDPHKHRIVNCEYILLLEKGALIFVLKCDVFAPHLSLPKVLMLSHPFIIDIEINTTQVYIRELYFCFVRK